MDHDDTQLLTPRVNIHICFYQASKLRVYILTRKRKHIHEIINQHCLWIQVQLDLVDSTGSGLSLLYFPLDACILPPICLWFLLCRISPSLTISPQKSALMKALVIFNGLLTSCPFPGHLQHGCRPPSHSHTSFFPQPIPGPFQKLHWPQDGGSSPWMSVFSVPLDSGALARGNVRACLPCCPNSLPHFPVRTNRSLLLYPEKMAQIVQIALWQFKGLL